MSEPWRAELEDAYYSTDTWKDGLVAVARYVLSDTARWRGLLGMESPAIVGWCFKCGREIGMGTLYSFERGKVQHAYECPREVHTFTRDTPVPYTVPSNAEGQE